MSWSFYASGKPAALAAKVAEQLSAIKCVEPEETIKNKVAEALVVSLKAMPANFAVKVEASGSQSTPDSSKPNEAINGLKVSIEPLWGFVE